MTPRTSPPRSQPNGVDALLPCSLCFVSSFGLFCFCCFGPVHWAVTVFTGIVLGWNAALYYSTTTTDTGAKP